MTIVQAPSFISVPERLNLSENTIANIEDLIMYGIYRAYVNRQSDNVDFEVALEPTVNELFFNYSGTDLAGALYLLAEMKSEASGPETRRAIGNLMLISHLTFGTLEVSGEQFDVLKQRLQDYVINHPTNIFL